jgi:glucose/arabinose dehydrogenase
VAAAAAPCATPLETRTPTPADQKPAFPEQTRVCGIQSNVAYDVAVVATGIAKPWSVEPLPGGDLLVTEKPGRLRVVSASGALGAPVAGVPRVDARGQGGLLDVALSPTFARDRTLFWSFSEPRGGGNATSVARGVLSADRTRLDSVRVILRALPVYDGDKHFGSRLAFGADGMLYVTLGDRSDTPMRPHAQRLDSHMGKILRVRPDGTAPSDNPFAGRAGALPEIWSLGHRNVQAARSTRRGAVGIEHGTRGGRRAEPRAEGEELRLAGRRLRRRVLGRRSAEGAPQREGHRAAGLLLGPGDRAVGRAVLHRERVPGVAQQPVRGRAAEQRLVRLALPNDRVTARSTCSRPQGSASAT